MKALNRKARLVLSRHTRHGADKHEAKLLGAISSIGTERSYRQCITNYFAWCEENGIHPDRRANLLTLKNYLLERSEWVQQKTLNQERQALQLIYKQELPYVKSQQVSVLQKRSYSLPMVSAIVVHQHEKNAITSWLAFFSGIRAHEAATIMRIYERDPSNHRNWDERRFAGLKDVRYYTVQGKGGLIRVVAVPSWLADKLEAKRRQPVVVVDREILYQSYYDIGYGQAWSQSFTSASQQALGFSRGGHGLRHSFAKWRLLQLIELLDSDSHTSENSTSEEQALLLVSQLLGHFRLDIVYTYLR